MYKKIAIIIIVLVLILANILVALKKITLLVYWILLGLGFITARVVTRSNKRKHTKT